MNYRLTTTLYGIVCGIIGIFFLLHGLFGLPLDRMRLGWLFRNGVQPSRPWLIAAGAALVAAAGIGLTWHLLAPEPFPDLSRDDPRIFRTQEVLFPSDGLFYGAGALALALIQVGIWREGGHSFSNLKDAAQAVLFLAAGPLIVLVSLTILRDRFGPSALVVARPQFEFGERLEARLRLNPQGEEVGQVTLRLLCAGVNEQNFRMSRNTTQKEVTAFEIWKTEVQASIPRGGRELAISIPIPAVIPEAKQSWRRRIWTLRVAGQNAASGYDARFGALPIGPIKDRE